MSLTKKISKACNGSGLMIVIGAALNIISSASDRIYDDEVKRKIADLLRKIATKLEQGVTQWPQ